MPDICTALALGEHKGKDYEDWCARHLRDPYLNEHEWYQIRCKLLHEGSTNPKARVGTVIRYPSFRFIARGSGRHGDREPNGAVMLDVGALHDEMVAGMERWFADVEAGTAPGAGDVAGRLSDLVAVEVREKRDAATLTLGPEVVFSTASEYVSVVTLPVGKPKP